MARFGSLAAGAFVLTTALGAAEQADAQANEVVLPHPDGEIAVDVSRVTLDTQARVMEELLACLEKADERADIDKNGKIEGAEQWDQMDEHAFCAESAEQEFLQADAKQQTIEAKARIEDAKTRAAEAEAQGADADARAEEADARLAAANAKIDAITNGLIDGAKTEQGS